MKISEFLTDDVILSEIGERISRRRLDLQLTQEKLAEQAGIAKRTLERIEAGSSSQMSSLIRILRALDSLSGLERMIPEVAERPMDLLKRKGKKRQRASTRRNAEKPDTPWTWNDDI